MGLEDWTEARLRAYVQEMIDRSGRAPELPQLPEPYVDDLLKHDGEKWKPFTVPSARLWRSTAQTLGPGAPIAITWDTQRFDTETEPPGMWDPNASQQRLTAKQAGVYVVIARLRFASSATGLRAYLQKTDVAGANTIIDSSNAYTGGGGTDYWILLATIIDLARNEYVQVFAGHDALANVDVESESDQTPVFSIAWVAPLFRQLSGTGAS